MKNKQTTLLSKLLLLAPFLVLSFNISFAQTSDQQFMKMKKAGDNSKTKKDQSNVNTNKASNSNVVAPSPAALNINEDISKGRAKAVADNEDGFSKPVPVTYVGDEKKMTEVNYTIDSQLSNFDNLNNMIDLRDKVHASDNHASLIQTAKYNQLLSDITVYKAKFNADVNKTGFENCSRKEQSLFLSFLKEEGKKEEYTLYMNKLKKD